MLACARCDRKRLSTGLCRGLGPPDLQTANPTNLYLEKNKEMPDGKFHYYFDSTIQIEVTAEELEMQADLGSRDLFQNVYDQNVGGNLVPHTPASRAI